jgi:hypothetical protein
VLMRHARHVAATTFVGVLDGHTLNVHAVLPTFDGVRPTLATLLFAREKSCRQTPLTVGATYDGAWEAEGTVVLGDGPGRLSLSAGVWRLRMDVILASGEKRRLDLRQLAVRESHRDGPTVATPSCPDTGSRYQPSTSSFGVWRIAVRPGRPRAEVVRLRVDVAGAEIIGRFVQVADPTGATAEFMRRGDGLTHATPVSVEGDLFRVRAPLADMIPAAGAKDIWDVRVRVAEQHRLRVGRYLHDLSNLKAVIRPFERRMLMPDGAVIHLRPYYTPAGSLALACTRADTKAAP